MSTEPAPQPRAVRRARAFVTVLGVLGGGASVVVLMSSQKFAHTEFPLVTLLLPILIAVVVLHELGHLGAAALVGSTVLGFSVGPVGFERRRGGLRLRRNHRREAAGWAYIVPDFSRDVRRQVLIYTAGGPFANVLIGSILLPLAWPVHAAWFEPMSAVLFAFGLQNLVIGISNLIPGAATFHNDGSNLLHWWKNDEVAQRASRIMKLYADSLRGVLASELPREDVAAFETEESVGMRLFGSYIALRAAQQRRDSDAFAAIYERCESMVLTLDARGYAEIRALWALTQLEFAFERVCEGEPHVLDIDEEVAKKMPPFIRYRIEAVHAKASCDSARLCDVLSKARRDVSGIFDVATRHEEEVLLARIERAPWKTPVPRAFAESTCTAGAVA